MKIKKPTIYDLSIAIMNIRKRKLPNPKKIGNAGSFFMNPIVEMIDFINIRSKYPNITGYSIIDNNKKTNKVKLSASSLIESIGWKGKKKGNVGIYEKLPIVLVNYGKARGIDIYSFSEEITKKIKNKLGILLSREVNIIQ
ncbi:UDP-N-acetylmuramate dehydrogenase [Blattabacterium cuenoti]|uniref:hypothetical protein n=1 Tax=Blattabacterium cuenoti TaxID=1653831 RepID=UPI001EE9DBDF|nr:hypothetical protein [Blattabacterium cuenoti]